MAVRPVLPLDCSLVGAPHISGVLPESLQLGDTITDRIAGLFAILLHVTSMPESERNRSAAVDISGVLPLLCSPMDGIVS